MTTQSAHSHIIIRPLLDNDSAACAFIDSEVSLQTWTDASLHGQQQSGSLAFTAKTPQDCVVGYIIGRAVADELEIYRIAVARQYQRQGIAMLLMSKLIQEAKKRHAATAFLEVSKDNSAAIGLYEKCGFKLIHTRKKYYTNTGEDALVMAFQFD